MVSVRTTHGPALDCHGETVDSQMGLGRPILTVSCFLYSGDVSSSFLHRVAIFMYRVSHSGLARPARFELRAGSIDRRGEEEAGRKPCR